MSASALFEVETSVSTAEIEGILKEIWHGGYVDVFLRSQRQGLKVHLAYFTERPGEMAELQRAVTYLLSISRHGYLYYWRDWDIYSDDDNNYTSIVTLDELVTPAFAPSMHDGIHYRYRIE